MGKDLHKDSFDEATITKLEIFEAYAEAWLPTFIKQPYASELHIYDCFAGTGKDIEGTAGSPLRILRKVKEFEKLLESENTKVHIHLNEFGKKKFNQLHKTCEELKTALNFGNKVEIEYENKDFKELFPTIFPIIKQKPSLVYMDQNGIKFLPYIYEFEKTKQTDFIYFVSSEHAGRFGNSNEFKKYLNVDCTRLKGEKRTKIHETLTTLLKETLPSGSELKLYPFSLQKEATKNVHGIIFGASHYRAVEKFLNIAWNKNNINGNANFDIENETDAQLAFDFDGTGAKISKVEKFKKGLREQILDSHIANNKDVLVYCYEKGHIASHGRECVVDMKKAKEIDYKGHPCISYDSVFNSEKIVEYKTRQ